MEVVHRNTVCLPRHLLHWLQKRQESLLWIISAYLLVKSSPFPDTLGISSALAPPACMRTLWTHSHPTIGSQSHNAWETHLQRGGSLLEDPLSFRSMAALADAILFASTCIIRNQHQVRWSLSVSGHSYNLHPFPHPIALPTIDIINFLQQMMFLGIC